MQQTEPRIDVINDFLQRFNDVATERVQLETLRARVRNLMSMNTAAQKANSRLHVAFLFSAALNVALLIHVAMHWPAILTAVRGLLGVQ